MAYFVFFFNAVATSTSVYYKHEVCLITITKTSVLLYMPFLKWVFLCLPSGIIEFEFGFCIFTRISGSTVLRVILFLDIISFKIHPLWMGEDKLCFIFCNKTNIMLKQLWTAGCPDEGPEDSS